MAKKAKKTKKSNSLDHKLHPIEASFNEEMKEFKLFKDEQIKQYTADGQNIDLTAFEQHFKTMYLFGKLNELKKELAELKGEKNVQGKERTTGKGNKGTTTKARGNKSNEQLQLGL